MAKQLTQEYTVNGKTYTVHLSMQPVEDTPFFRTAYRFKVTPDARDTIFYCFTSEKTEVVFNYIIEAMEMFGDDWKNRLKFDYKTKLLLIDGTPLPV